MREKIIEDAVTTGKYQAGPVPPIAYCLVADVDAALLQQIFDVSKAERVLDVQQHRQADHLGRGLEVAERAAETREGGMNASTLASLLVGAFALTDPASKLMLAERDFGATFPLPNRCSFWDRGEFGMLPKIRWIAAVAATAAAASAHASETITYSYDARGRLVKVERSGTVNNGVKADYTLDKADNRTNTTTTGSPNPSP